MEWEWISVEDQLPEIPEGQYGVSVIAATFDLIYAELNDGDGYSVHEVHYGSTRDRNGEQFGEYKGSSIEFDFMEIWNCGHDACWGPTGDSVTHWMYMPPSPIKKI